MPAEVLDEIWEVLEGGAEVAGEKIIQFPVDQAVEGAAELTGTTTEVLAGNGVATEVSQLTVIEGGASSATTTGVGLLSVDLGVAGAAIAPILGIAAGVGLYNLTPSFWDGVADKLLKAGQTIGGKVQGFLNGNTKQVGFSEETIEIFKQAFIDAGLYESQYPTTIDKGAVYKGLNSSNLINLTPEIYASQKFFTNVPVFLKSAHNPNNFLEVTHVRFYNSSGFERIVPYTEFIKIYRLSASPPKMQIVDSYELDESYPSDVKAQPYLSDGYAWNYGAILSIQDITNNIIKRFCTTHEDQYIFNLPDTLITPNRNGYPWQPYFVGKTPSDAVLPNSTQPTTAPFPETYPNYKPWDLPEQLPRIYPVEIPQVNPNPSQDEAQNPKPLPNSDPVADWLPEVLPRPQPNPNPYPQPSPNPDPDPQPQPEPLPDPEPAPEPSPDPVEPNPTPTPGPIPILPGMPDAVESNAMFTVYNPSVSQLNAFGGWLWSTSIIDQILKMWANPLDGIINLMKVYATPSTGATSPIVVGYLTSEASAPIVTSQFVTVNCGTVSIQELRKNATDYTPYVSLHLYLPFIGIVELDPDEFMNGQIGVVYHIDVYTGTCMAEVRSVRSPDMPNPSIIYTFSGNASQQLPVTAGTWNGMFSSLVTMVGGGLAIASGGSLSVLGGATAIGHSLTREMFHTAHSGALSANAGIMAGRTPYVIISRKQGYDANGYNSLYGYPANKTVYLGNCSGFVRVKAGRLNTRATENEKKEIISLLENGVIF